MINGTHIINTKEQPPALALNNLSINHRDGVRALSDISASIHSGEFVAITGVSGSGKTSLLRAIQGHLTIAAGSINKNGRVATIYQDLRLVKQATCLDNVLHGALSRFRSYQLIAGFPLSEKELAFSIIKRVGLAKKAGCRIKQLSGGEKQRVAIGRAVMQQPSILLADEPIASLDKQNAIEILRLLKQLAKEENIAVICVLHDPELATEYADRIITLHDGTLVEQNLSQRQDSALSTGLSNNPLLRSNHLKLITDSDLTKTKSNTKNYCTTSCIIDDCDRNYLKCLGYNLKTKITLFLSIAIFLFALGWSVVNLNLLQGQEIAQIFSSLYSFILSLFPNSFEQFSKIPWWTLTVALAETIQMAFVATIFAALLSLPLAALAASNLKLAGIQRVIRFLLNAIRTVPSLIWALLFVAAIGLGTGAGVAALTAYSIGYLSKFFYEAFENIDPLAPGALKDIGASAAQRFRFAVWPAAKPALIASLMFMFEYNVRAASILGIVDAGGIGFYLKQYIDFRFFPAVTAGLLLILVVVVVLDSISSILRKRLLDE